MADKRPSSDQKPSTEPSLLDDAIHLAAGAAGVVGKVSKLITSTLQAPLHMPLPGLRRRDARHRRPAPGARAGIDHIPDIHTPPPPGTIYIHCMDYNLDRLESYAVENLTEFLATPRPEWVKVRWINVDGLHPYVINQFKEAFKFHTLAAEDVLHVPQRPKVENYDNHLFLTTRMLTLGTNHLHGEQMSAFYFGNTLLTFQEDRGDVFDSIRARIRTPGSRHRINATGYLLYSLLDAIVDHCFPILEHYGDLLEEIEGLVISQPKPDLVRRLHVIKRELALIRRVVWPTRDMLDELERSESGQFSETARTYMRDVYDHSVQIMDIVETYREMAASLTDLYVSAISHRMNDVMKVLTIIATLFIPITFLAGVYGMNYEHIPELELPYFYMGFWGVCFAVVGGLMVFFYRKGWLGRSL